jgi:hypothetical protein
LGKTIKVKIILYLFFIIASVVFITSCNEDDFTTSSNVRLEFSTDTVSFDTIFTTIGSTTQYFKVKNPENKAVNISGISLAGGANSPFRLNINGVAASMVNNVELYAGDSLFIFVEVTVDPTNQNLPMVVKDSVVFSVNGNIQDVKLVAFGQDVHLFNGEIIQSQHWTNDKPYLIFNYVIVDSLETLIIDPGCRIYFHKKSSLFVKGTLEVNGTFEEPVTFQGDRLEKIYSDVPSQWGYYVESGDGNIYVYGGIHFLVGSKDNVIDYAIIKNANKGIQADSLGMSGNPMLTLKNSRIENMSLYSLDARTTYIKASNCVFANSGSYSLALLFGGKYEFNHCTVANYYGYETRTRPAVLLSNYFIYENVVYSYDLESAVFSNCIIYGNRNDEILLDNFGPGLFNFQFNQCLLRSNAYSVATNGFGTSTFNLEPRFTKINELNFMPDSLSPARNIGNVAVATLFPVDLNNNSRLSDAGPDLGALEWVPAKKSIKKGQLFNRPLSVFFKFSD